MKKGCLLTLFLIICAVIQAQTFKEFEVKAFNWGAKVGFNSSFPIINSFTIDDVQIEDVNTEYKVGYMASVFCRINFDRFFIQPAFAWHNTESSLSFNTPNITELNINVNPQRKQMLEFKNHSIDVPVLIGYNIVKEGPFALSVMAGPKIKYNYKVSFHSTESEKSNEYINDNTPFGLDIVSGISVSVWRLFFDFTYEFGLNEIDSDFKEKISASPIENKIMIDKRTNLMSFSLGILF